MQYPSKPYSKKKRFLEMNRRVGVLECRREHLENELGQIKIALSSLDKQMRQHDAYEQLVFKNKIGTKISS